MKKKFYITAAIPYVNAKPHIGHALEFVQTDVIARYHRILGKDVVSLSGGDENALKNVQAAEKANVPIQKFVDDNTQSFFELSQKLNVNFDVWQKGSDQKRHFFSVQKLWKLCFENGDIYKEKYEGLYCVGCEAFYTKNELDKNGECPEHPGKKLEKISEENYFFRLSKYQNRLIKLIETDQLKIIPEFRKNEILSFLKEPLKDLSISRTNERAKNWGVQVPNDPNQRIYVWFDALNIYQSGVGFGWNEKKYKKYWPADIHVIGKGISRFHLIYWPAFLLSAKLPLPKSIFIHGYLTVNGQKISKTVGNVIDPFPLIDKYGADSIRYYLLAKVSPFGDGDFSEDKLKETYNSDLANGIGNLVSRVAKLAESTPGYIYEEKKEERKPVWDEVETEINDFRFDSALSVIWGEIKKTDEYLSEKRPWQLKLSDENQKLSRQVIISSAIQNIFEIAKCLEPFLPETSEKIEKQFSENGIKTTKPLFPRIK